MSAQQSTIELGVSEVLLATKPASLRAVRVRVKMPTGVVSMPLETASVNITSASHPVRFDWSHSVPVTKGGRSFTALEAALKHARSRPGAADVSFTLIDATTSKELGSATIDLAALDPCASVHACAQASATDLTLSCRTCADAVPGVSRRSRPGWG